MTYKSHTFVELSDILSFRFDCPKCHCSVVIPRTDFKHIPTECPNGCNQDWKEILADIKKEFDDFVRAMSLVQLRMSEVGLSFSLELREYRNQYDWRDPFEGGT